MTDDNESSAVALRAERPDFVTQTKFEDFNLAPEILAALAEAQFNYCTPIQEQVLPISLTGKDVAGQAQTGTGKTAAFLVTIFARLMASTKKKAGMPSAIIITPTRELALQVHDDAEVFASHTGLSLGLAIGGIDYVKQIENIRRGPDVVICTPGRIIDFLKQGVFKTSAIEILVIDEADRLFDLGFVKDLRFLLRRMPHYEKRQSMLFSATLSYRVLELTYDFMNLPEFISVTPDDVTVKGIEQSLYHVGKEEKFSLLLGIMEHEDWSRVLIFANTKNEVEWLAQKLMGNGLPAEAITGDLPQPKRLRLMEKFKDGRTRILVATDVASRGIHVEDISHVINYDLPQDIENYVHRIGRTARAGKTGKAISLACEMYVFHLEPLEKLLGYQIPVVWPEADWIKEDKAGRVRIERRKTSSRSTGKRKWDGEKKTRASGGPPRTQKKIVTVTRPGGIFGLSPRFKAVSPEEASVESDEAGKDEEIKKKKRKRRRKKKTNSETNGTITTQSTTEQG